MRTTINLPADLHTVALQLARENHQNLSPTVAALMRQGLGDRPRLRRDPQTGLLVAEGGPELTHEDVRALEDGR